MVGGMNKWSDIDAQQVCCGEVMRSSSHEGQPIADQVRRGYQCSKCQTTKDILVDIFDRSWRIAARATPRHPPE